MDLLTGTFWKLAFLCLLSFIQLSNLSGIPPSAYHQQNINAGPGGQDRYTANQGLPQDRYTANQGLPQDRYVANQDYPQPRSQDRYVGNQVGNQIYQEPKSQDRYVGNQVYQSPGSQERYAPPQQVATIPAYVPDSGCLNNTDVKQCCTQLVLKYKFSGELLMSVVRDVSAAEQRCIVSLCTALKERNLTPEGSPNLNNECWNASNYVINGADVVYLMEYERAVAYNLNSSSQTYQASYQPPSSRVAGAQTLPQGGNPAIKLTKTTLLKGLTYIAPQWLQLGSKTLSNLPKLTVWQRTLAPLFKRLQDYTLLYNLITTNNLNDSDVYDMLWCPEVIEYYDAYLKYSSQNRCSSPRVKWILTSYCQVYFPQRVIIDIRMLENLLSFFCNLGGELEVAIRTFILAFLQNDMTETDMLNLLSYNAVPIQDFEALQYETQLNDMYRVEKKLSLWHAVKFSKATCYPYSGDMDRECQKNWLLIANAFAKASVDASFVIQDFENIKTSISMEYVSSLANVAQILLNIQPIETCNLDSRNEIFHVYYISIWSFSQDARQNITTFNTFYDSNFRGKDQTTQCQNMATINEALGVYKRICNIHNRYTSICIQETSRIKNTIGGYITSRY